MGQRYIWCNVVFGIDAYRLVKLKGNLMSHIDLAVLFLLLGILFITLTVLFQMYVAISESYTIDRYKNTPKMLWVAVSLFFTFSLSVYYFCPNSRKKGIVFFILGAIGVGCYGAGMYFKHLAQA